MVSFSVDRIGLVDSRPQLGGGGGHVRQVATLYRGIGRVGRFLIVDFIDVFIHDAVPSVKVSALVHVKNKERDVGSATCQGDHLGSLHVHFFRFVMVP